MKLVIDRAKWARGDGKGMLLRPSDRKMCCLGFYGLACGIQEAVLLDEGLPSEAAPDLWPDWLVENREVDYDQKEHWEDSSACNRLVETNDGTEIPEAERERKIAGIFAKHGVTVEFVGDAAEPQS